MGDKGSGHCCGHAMGSGHRSGSCVVVISIGSFTLVGVISCDHKSGSEAVVMVMVI